MRMIGPGRWMILVRHRGAPPHVRTARADVMFVRNHPSEVGGDLSSPALLCFVDDFSVESMFCSRQFGAYASLSRAAIHLCERRHASPHCMTSSQSATSIARQRDQFIDFGPSLSLAHFPLGRAHQSGETDRTVYRTERHRCLCLRRFYRSGTNYFMSVANPTGTLVLVSTHLLRITRSVPHCAKCQT